MNKVNPLRIARLQPTPLAACLAVALAIGSMQTLAAGANTIAAVSQRHANVGGAHLLALAPTNVHEDAARKPSASREPAVLPVFNCADDGPGSLRVAVASAVSGDTIDMTALTCSTITLTTGAIDISINDLTLSGPGSAALAIYRDQHQQAYFGVLAHSGTGVLTVSGLTVGLGINLASGGCIDSYGSVVLDHSVVAGCFAGRLSAYIRGGGVYTAGNLTLQDSSLIGNTAQSSIGSVFGGGAFAKGDLVVRNSRVSGNQAISTSATALGGGLCTAGNTQIIGSTIDHNDAGYAPTLPGNVGGLDILGFAASAVIVNSTISGNTASQFIGGVYSNTPLTVSNSTIAFNASSDLGPAPYFAAGLQVYLTSADLESSIIANNTVASQAFDLSGYAPTITGSNNLIVGSLISPPGTLTADPQLGPLQDNGGSTYTHALASTSPALDHGNNAAALPFDQRGPGFPRVAGAAADIGAFEFQVVTDRIFADGFD